MTMDALTASDAVKPAIAKQIAEWQKTADRYRPADQTLIARPRAPLPSRPPTGSGGRGQVRAMPSAEAPNSMARAASAIMLPPSTPTICTPSPRSALSAAGENRVCVQRRIDHPLRRDIAARSGAVFDYDLLAKIA
jgi:hypothetical protein